MQAHTHVYLNLELSSSAAFVCRLGFYISSFLESQGNGVSTGKFLKKKKKSGGHLYLCYTALLSK